MDKLLARAAERDPVAMKRLMLDHDQRLEQLVSVLLPKDVQRLLAPCDVVQEIWIDVYRTLARFEDRGPDAFVKWVNEIARMRVRDAIKRCRARKRASDKALDNYVPRPEDASAEDLLSLLAVHERTPSRSAADREMADAVQRALVEVAPDYRQVLRLRFIEGLGVAEVASRMGRTEGAVQMLCSRGLKELGDVLKSASRYL